MFTESLNHYYVQVLSCLVGHHIAQEQVYSIVKRTMREADINEDQFISLEEFKQVSC